MTARRILLLVATTLPLGTGPAAAHGWYTGLVSPQGQSCCNDRDCHPVGQCVRADGKEGLLIEGDCLPIPQEKVLGISSPDGRAHACWNYLNGKPQIICVIRGGDS
jgi:hypothetical protein